jgi:hypothetical protein
MRITNNNKINQTIIETAIFKKRGKRIELNHCKQNG